MTDLDSLDRKILARLQQEARRPISDIAKELGIPITTAHMRLKKMHDAGVIKSHALVLDPQALGFQVQAFVGLTMNQSHAFGQVLSELKKLPEITEILYTTGQYSLFLRIWAKSIPHLHLLLSQQIQAVANVQSTETFIVLDAPVHRDLPLST
jgi:Lrp/AsnC family transcriptional regulator for asnA, asnC and gidA